jgi:glutathione S-transferase
MKLYFSPLACSLAVRIALYEAGIDAGFEQVALGTKRTSGGDDYLGINPRGQVPALVLDDGTLLTEVPAILQHVANLAPASGLLPPVDRFERTQVQQWLNYVATEVHKGVFYLMFNPHAPAQAKAFAQGLLPGRYDFVAKALAGRDHLVGDSFTVADAYLVTTFAWADAAGIDLSPWPVITAYRDRLMARPAVARAVAEEFALLQAG